MKHVFHGILFIHRIIMLFSGKYLRIKVEDHKMLVLVSKLSPKLLELNASYPCKYTSILWDFYVFQCISTIHHIIIHFSKKYLRRKLKNINILVLISKLLSKLEEVKAGYLFKHNSIGWHMHFIVFYLFTT